MQSFDIESLIGANLRPNPNNTAEGSKSSTSLSIEKFHCQQNRHVPTVPDRVRQLVPSMNSEHLSNKTNQDDTSRLDNDALTKPDFLFRTLQEKFESTMSSSTFDTRATNSLQRFPVSSDLKTSCVPSSSVASAQGNRLLFIG